MQINKQPYGIQILWNRGEISIWRPGLWEPGFFTLDSCIAYPGCKVYATPFFVIAIRKVKNEQIEI